MGIRMGIPVGMLDFDDFSRFLNIFGKFWSHILLLYPKIASKMLTFHSAPVLLVPENWGAYKKILGVCAHGSTHGYNTPLTFL